MVDFYGVLFNWNFYIFFLYKLPSIKAFCIFVVVLLILITWISEVPSYFIPLLLSIEMLFSPDSVTDDYILTVF